MSKSHSKCCVALCPRRTASGMPEKDKAKRYCFLHRPEHLTRLRIARETAHPDCLVDRGASCRGPAVSLMGAATAAKLGCVYVRRPQCAFLGHRWPRQHFWERSRDRCATWAPVFVEGGEPRKAFVYPLPRRGSVPLEDEEDSLEEEDRLEDERISREVAEKLKRKDAELARLGGQLHLRGGACAGGRLCGSPVGTLVADPEMASCAKCRALWMGESGRRVEGLRW